MNATKLIVLKTGQTIATIDIVCLMDLKKGLDEKGYHVLEVKPTDLDKLRSASCEPVVLETLSDVLGTQGSMLIGYADDKPDANWSVTGRVTDHEDNPLPGLRVLAYDKDVISQDDFLGCTFTNEFGEFEIRYIDEDFKSGRKLVDLEGNPDVYVEISHPVKDVTKRTVVKDESKEEEHFEIKISLESKTKLLRPVVGRYYIEEDALENEIEKLREQITNDPENADLHFNLGICLIELVKADLRKSEWILGEVRSDDDVLAMNAIESLDKAADLDPSLAEEAKHYRDYAQDLQNLAL